MEINNNIATGQNITTKTSQEIDRSSLSMDDFLKIMAAEISNQNPMSSDGGSGGSADYLSQMSQFALLDEMTKISESINVLTLMGQQQYTFSLIGKEVTLSNGEGENVKGLVEKVRFEEGYGVIQVNGKDYYLGSIIEVANTEVGK